jgi:hypothetical protein
MRRAAWHRWYRAPTLDAPRHEPILLVLGMHRSGTSSAVGILEDLGFRVPGTVPPDGTGDNKRGTREPVELTSLSNRVLEVNGYSWREPPTTAVKYLKRHVANRNQLIEQCLGDRCVLKDPRMLLMLDFWESLTVKPMAVVRNPIDVADSLVRRGEPLTQAQAVELWQIYNRRLLEFVKHRNCPIACFDLPHFGDQVIHCLDRLGYSHNAPICFFDDRLVRSRTDHWRTLVDHEVVSLYGELMAFTIDTAATRHS